MPILEKILLAFLKNLILLESQLKENYNNNNNNSVKNNHQPVIHPWVLERVFGGGMPFHTNQLELGKRHYS